MNGRKQKRCIHIVTLVSKYTISMQSLLFNYIAASIGIIGSVCNILWIAVYFKAYQIHIASVRFPKSIDISVSIQAMSDWILSIVLAIFNIMFIIDSEFTQKTNIILMVMSFVVDISFFFSFCMIPVVGRICYHFLKYVTTVLPHQQMDLDQINQINKLAIKPTIFCFILCVIMTIFLYVETNQVFLTPSTTYAYFELTNIATVVRNQSAGFLISASTFYYYYKIIKLSQANASAQDVTTCLCCKLKLTKLSKVVLVIPVTFITTILFASLTFIIDGAIQDKPSPLSDFVRMFPLFLYSAIANGFFICNSSKTYKSILKNFMYCKSQQSVVSLVVKNSQLSNFEKKQSMTWKSKAIHLAPEV